MINLTRILFLCLALTIATSLSCATSHAKKTFNPPKTMEIERTWSMMAYGESIGVIRSTSHVVEEGGKTLVKNTISSMVGVRPGVQLNSVETCWIGPEGMEGYEGAFQETGNPDKTSIQAQLVGDQLQVGVKMQENSLEYPMEFTKGKDYNWSTIYMDVGAQHFRKNRNFRKRILDIYSLESKVVNGKYLGTEMLEQGSHHMKCHVIEFDYGDVKGTFWMAEDDLGWFLVKEEAESEGVPFQLYLDEYKIGEKAATATQKEKKDFGF